VSAPAAGAAPRVSILLPCRDAAQYLPDTIASIQAQSFQNFEVVAVDDGSTDETPSILRDWAAEDPRVRVLTQKALGIVAALQRAVKAAKGDILVRMDADDVAYSNRISKQVEMLDDNPDIGACGTLVRYFPRQEVQGGAQRYESWINTLVDHDDIVRDIFVECPIAHPTLAIRRKVLEKVGGYTEEEWPEDYDLVFRLWRAGIRMAKVPEILLRWRERPDRASRNNERYSDDAFRRCKVHYLKQSMLNGFDGVVVWGAGPIGKAFALELQQQDVPVRAFVELDPRKVGQTIHQAPVIAPEDVGTYTGALVVAAVGQPNARDEIRRVLVEHGWEEGTSFVAVA
jgi:glycosyltransferase involved in cell wall biosynthesis